MKNEIFHHFLSVHEDHEDDENAEIGVIQRYPVRDCCITCSFKAEANE
ncbi:MAG: hypothetical protein ACKO3R_04750 [bacterium]